MTEFVIETSSGFPVDSSVFKLDFDETVHGVTFTVGPS